MDEIAKIVTTGQQQILATLNLRPQDRFRNPKSYFLNPEHDVGYCSFKIDAPPRPGIYRIFIGDSLVYIGRAANLRNRLSTQYGNVSPRHPFAGGPLQKCRTNAKINAALCEGLSVFVRWEVIEDYIARERELLRDVSTRPLWNMRG